METKNIRITLDKGPASDRLRLKQICTIETVKLIATKNTCSYLTKDNQTVAIGTFLRLCFLISLSK